MGTWQSARVLISQSSLFHIAGSEVVTYELATFFASEGAEVIVATLGFNEGWQKELESLGRVHVKRIDDPALDQLLAERAPDVAWIHHQVIPPRLVNDPDGTCFVFHHMSTTVVHEFPLSPSVEASLASAVVFPAQETLQAQVASGLLTGVAPERLAVLGNPAPDAFDSPGRELPEQPRRILVVSNHAPEEVLEAEELLGVDLEFVHVGERADQSGRKAILRPADLSDVDGVLTIGKTVQYALLSQLPVYCYDHFGGPGWLTLENIELAREKNFSGRGFERKPSAEIARELVAGYTAARHEAAALYDRYAAVFRLSDTMRHLFGEMEPRPVSALDETERKAFLARQDLMNGMVNAVEARSQTIDYLTTLNAVNEQRLAEAEARFEALRSEYDNVRASRAYRSVARILERRPRTR
jgi:hypothetical protein